MVTETDISVFLEHFSHDSVIKLNAVETSTAGEVLAGQAQGFFVELSNTQGFVIQDLPPWLPL